LSLVALAAGCGGSTKPPLTPVDGPGGGGGQAEVGKPAPDLSIQTLNGKGRVALDSMQGKLLVIDFWATWCGPCKQSFPKLEELSKKLGDKAEVVGISVDEEEKGILEFAKENGATFAIGWDQGHAIAGRWDVKKMPTTFIVDGTGKVRFIHAGYHEGETVAMEKEIGELLHESPSSSAVAKDEKKDDKKDDKSADDKKDAVAAAPASEEDKTDAATKKKGGKKRGASKGAGKKPVKKKS
jgi:thiol-disulfide isomerase/thioredoxin